MSKAREIADLLDSSGKVTADDLDVGAIGGRRNLIINGGFDVWQRGTSSTAYSSSTRGYIADRWSFRYASLMERSTDVPADLGFKYSAKVTTVSADDPFIIQGIENVDKYAGMEVTFSYWIKPSAALTLRDDYLAGVHGTHVLVANVWQKITNTFTVPTGVQTNDYLYIQFPASTVATYYITGVQLELGSVATPFEHRSYGEELALCQRYFWNIPESSSLACEGYVTISIYARLYFYHPVEMRTVPTVTGSLSNLTSNIRSSDNTNLSAVNNKISRVSFRGNTTGRAYAYGGSNYPLTFDAEL